jgi:hypothetical protein
MSWLTAQLPIRRPWARPTSTEWRKWKPTSTRDSPFSLAASESRCLLVEVAKAIQVRRDNGDMGEAHARKAFLRHGTTFLRRRQTAGTRREEPSRLAAWSAVPDGHHRRL